MALELALSFASAYKPRATPLPPPLSSDAQQPRPILSFCAQDAAIAAFAAAFDELQADLDACIKEYIEARPHQGRGASATFPDATPMTKEKIMAA